MIIAKIMAFAVLFLLSALGLSVIVRYVGSAVLGERRKSLLSVVFLDGTDTEYTLRCALSIHSANPAKGSPRIYAVDCGLSCEDRFVAVCLAKQYPELAVIKLEDFIRMAQDLDFEEYKYKAT